MMNEQPKLSPLEAAIATRETLRAELQDAQKRRANITGKCCAALQAGAAGDAEKKREGEKLAEELGRLEDRIKGLSLALESATEDASFQSKTEAEEAFRAEAAEMKADAEACILIAADLDAALDAVGKLRSDLATQIDKLNRASTRVRAEVYPELAEHVAVVLPTIKGRLGYLRVLDVGVDDYSKPAPSVEARLRIALRNIVDEKGAGQ
jgi:chromosome segregation ATPase